jgi:hypothetical protein
LGIEHIFVTTHLAMQALIQGEQPQIRYDTIMTPMTPATPEDS